MGAVRKWTGAQAQIDATERNAREQEKALKASEAAQTRQLQEQAQAAANAQSQQAARLAAEEKASAAVSAPMQNADVQLEAPPAEGGTANRARRKAQYGRTYSGGIQI